MDPIPEDVVDNTWRVMSRMKSARMTRLVEKMSIRQPVLLAYLMAAGEADFLTEEEKESLLYMGVVIWRIMSKGDRPLYQITERLLDKMEVRNERMLEFLSGESSGDFISSVEMIFKNYNQSQVLRYVVEGLMEEDEGNEFSEDGKGYMLVSLKTIIDCLDYAPKRKSKR